MSDPHSMHQAQQRRVWEDAQRSWNQRVAQQNEYQQDQWRRQLDQWQMQRTQQQARQHLAASPAIDRTLAAARSHRSHGGLMSFLAPALAVAIVVVLTVAVATASGVDVVAVIDSLLNLARRAMSR